MTQGALEIFKELPHEFVDVSELPDVVARGDRNVLYGVMIERQHCTSIPPPTVLESLQIYQIPIH